MRLTWNTREQYDQLPNGSIVYIMGLTAQDQTARYSRFRGLTVAMCPNTHGGPAATAGRPAALQAPSFSLAHSRWARLLFFFSDRACVDFGGGDLGVPSQF